MGPPLNIVNAAVLPGGALGAEAAFIMATFPLGSKVVQAGAAREDRSRAVGRRPAAFRLIVTPADTLRPILYGIPLR